MDSALVADLGGGSRPGLVIFGILIPLAILALLAYGIWELVRSRSVAMATDPSSGSWGPARVVLDERFARGEIDAEDYVQRRTLLDGAATVGPAPTPLPATAPRADADPTTEQPVGPDEGTPRT